MLWRRLVCYLWALYRFINLDGCGACHAVVYRSRKLQDITTERTEDAARNIFETFVMAVETNGSHFLYKSQHCHGLWRIVPTEWLSWDKKRYLMTRHVNRSTKTVTCHHATRSYSKLIGNRLVDETITCSGVDQK